MEIEFAEIVQDSPDEPLHINIWVGGVCRSFLVEDVLAKMDAVEQPLAPDACPECGEEYSGACGSCAVGHERG